ncbi:hypothetical protein ACQUW5_03705 [Legionella sp. CNM-1927-20]|uniref:hypothetical protein n=1 Tax=Legionella sp. CNM-1927-20 TaxID=3422221 RepID=UPI00403A7DA2
MPNFQVAHIQGFTQVEDNIEAIKKQVSLLSYGGGDILFRGIQPDDLEKGMAMINVWAQSRNQLICIFEFSDDFSKLNAIYPQYSSNNRINLDPPVKIPEDIRQRLQKCESFFSRISGEELKNKKNKEEESLRLQKCAEIITKVREITAHGGFWKNEKSTGYVEFNKIVNQRKSPETILSELKKEAEAREKMLGPKLFTHRSPHSATLIDAILKENVEALDKLQKLASSYISEIPEDKTPRPGLLGVNEDDRL